MNRALMNQNTLPFVAPPGPLASAPVASAANLGLCYLETGDPLWPNGRLWQYGYRHLVESAQRFFSFAATRRIDVAGGGDSNQILNGTGWDHGIPKSIRTKYGIYATPVFGFTENNNSGSNSGYLCNYGQCTIPVATYPVQFQKYDWSSNFTVEPISSTMQGVYLASGSGIGGRIFVDVGHFSGSTCNARYHCRLGKFALGLGSYRRQVRVEQSPYNAIYLDALSIPVDIGDGLYDISCDIVNENTKKISYGCNSVNTADINGEFFGLTHRVENLDQTTGCAFTTIMYKGGKSARQMLVAWQLRPIEAVQEILRSLTAIQNDDPMLMIRINGGLNDRGDLSLSAGSNPAPSNTEDGFKDNVQGMVDIFTAAWEALGYLRENLYFDFCASHVPDITDTIMPFRKACSDLAKSNINGSYFEFAREFSYQDMVTNGYYNNSGADVSHLSIAGYEALSLREVNVLNDGSPIGLFPLDW